LNKDVTFDAVVSGDGECFCFEVDSTNFVKVTGEQPDVINHKLSYNEDTHTLDRLETLLLYPSGVFGFSSGKTLRIHVTVEELD
jgi:hypothetical protein